MTNNQNSRSGVLLLNREARFTILRRWQLGTPVRAEIAATSCKQRTGLPPARYTDDPTRIVIPSDQREPRDLSLERSRPLRRRMCRSNSKLKTSSNANRLLDLAVVLAEPSLRISKLSGENAKAN
jgi:hypothetical protein